MACIRLCLLVGGLDELCMMWRTLHRLAVSGAAGRPSPGIQHACLV